MIIDLQRFVATERPHWTQLERLLDKLEEDPNLRMTLDELRQFHLLFERASADLARISTFSAEPATRRYLENLVARGYGEIHETRERGSRFRPVQWFAVEFPRVFRKQFGAFLVSREAARSMLPLKRGTIVLMGSTSSLIGRAGYLNLAVGKFGQRALAQVLARELWPDGIHITHLIIDADINERAETEADAPRADPAHISEVVLSVHRQANTAWTSELDVRPWNERFWERC